MIQSIPSWEPYEPFLHQFTIKDKELFPYLAEAFAREEALAFGAFEGTEMTGMFLFDLIEEEYFVTDRWLTRSETAGREMLAHLKRAYPGCGVEFTFRPEDTLLKKLLLEAGATVFPEQRDMALAVSSLRMDTSGIVSLSKVHESAYFALHRDSDPDGETYWTGEMVAADKEGFLVLLALADGVPVGYLDLGLGDESNNVADLYVAPDHRRKGWGRKLLGKAVERTGAKPLTLQVDVDNEAAVALYESMGFRTAPDSGQVDAIWRIEG